MKRWAVAFLALFLAGCSGQVADPRPTDAPAIPVLQKVDADGLYNVTEIVGLVEGEPGVWTWDPLEGMVPDSFRLLLVQVGQAGGVNVTTDGDVLFDATSLTGEQVSSDSVCLSDYVQLPAPGGFYIDRSIGKNVDHVPTDPLNGSNDENQRYSAGGSGGSGGSGRSTSKATHEADLFVGEWVLIATGLTGYPPDQAAADGRWTYTVRASGPLRFVEVLPSGYLCGSGFERLGGQHASAPANLHVGGSGSIEALYGAFFQFCAPAIDQKNALPLNSADVDFLGTQTHLFTAGYTEFNSTQRGRITLTVQQWAGSPAWSMHGFWVPPMLGLPDVSFGLKEFCGFVP